MRKNLNFMWLALLVFTTSAVAKSATFEELFQEAEKKSGRLQSIYSRWEAASEQVKQVGALPDPRITYGYFIEPVQTKTGPQEQRIGIAQTIPWFGKLSLKEQVAAKDAEMLYEEYVATTLEIYASLQKSFFDYNFLRETIRINREHLQILELMEQTALSRFTTGKISQTTLTQIQIEQSKVEDRIQELEALRVPKSAEIYALAGLEMSEVLPWQENIFSPQNEPNSAILNAIMMAKNPQLKRLQIQVSREELKVKLADKEFYPDLTFSLEQIDTDGGKNPTVAMVSFNLPIWREKLHAGVSEANKRQRSAEELVRDLEIQLKASLAMELYRYQDSARKIALYDDNLIPKAKQTIEVALKSFESGHLQFADLLEAERTLLDLQLQRESNQSEQFKQLAIIENLIGQKIIRKGNNNEND
ncbi:MAG: TolC family protein [Lentisphaeria bacterium]